jgi:hypothetical protein
MKTLRLVLLVVLCLSMAVVSVSAQLGDVANSSFTVQNVGDGEAHVLINFYDEDGVVTEPTELNGSKPNPFSLDPGESFEVYVPGIPGLASGRYSVVILSDEEVVAIANLIGQNTAGTTFYNGSYSGVSVGADSAYLPSIVHDYYNWNSLISVQNAGSAATDVTVTYTCADGSTASDSKSNLQAGAAVHFDLETDAPAGLPANCGGSASIVSTGEPLIVIDNQSAAGGYTQSYNGFLAGETTVYAPALYDGYYTWVSSLNIRKIGAGDTTVTVAYSDGATDSTCALTDAAPSCQLYMPSDHDGASSLFAATITSSALPVVAIVNAANPNAQAQTYGGFMEGAATAGLPTVMKQYYGWDTAFSCQNIGSVATTLNLSYQGHALDDYDTASIDPGESVEVYQPGESFLPSGYRGSVTVTAAEASAEIACIVNQTHGANQAAGMGDWSMSYNAN